MSKAFYIDFILRNSKGLTPEKQEALRVWGCQIASQESGIWCEEMNLPIVGLAGLTQAAPSNV